MLDKQIMQVIFFAGVQATNTIDCVHFGVSRVPYSINLYFWQKQVCCSRYSERDTSSGNTERAGLSVRGVLQTPRRSAEDYHHQAQRPAHITPRGSWGQPGTHGQGYMPRLSPQPAAHSAVQAFWHDAAAGSPAHQPVYYDPQQMYAAVPGEHLLA